MLDEISYQSHQNWLERNYPSQDERIALITSWQEQKKIPTINYFLHLRLFNLALPIIKPQDSWLTVGDGYGFDAHFLKEQGCKVTASDISTTFLELSQNAGLIENYSAENAEKLSFADNTFDFVFCKEAFHHFPKPFVAVYEMLRVAKKGIILIEPQDPISRMPLLLALRNILDNIQTNLLEKIWRNRYSFEPVGNYVFKLSERECEKIAMGLFLPAIAFKGIQNNYYKKDISNFPATKKSKVFQKMNFKIFRDTLLARLGILPYQILSAIIFKQMPDQATIKKLKEAQYRFYVLPPNPYLQSNS